MLQSLLNTGTLINVEQLVDKLITLSVDFGKNIIAAILIYIIGRFIIRQISRLVGNLLEKQKLEPSVKGFIRSLLNILLNAILAFAIISKLGVETTSFTAILASAGVAIGMALSGNLSNFAGGLIILVFKPFKVGDFIDCAGPGVSGTVKEIQIFHTILTTLDNRLIYVPNGSLSSNAITNYSMQNIRRAEWIVGVEYGQDFEKAKAVLQRLIDEDSRILHDPAPMIALKALSSSSVDIVIRAWTRTDIYWDVYFDFNKKVYATFNQEGIGFPFPQLTVHQAKD